MTQRWGRDRRGGHNETAKGSGRLVGMTVGDDRIPIRVFVRNVLLSSVVRCSFNEWLENCIRLSEVVVDDIHEQ